VHGRFKHEVTTKKSAENLTENDVIVVNGHEIQKGRKDIRLAVLKMFYERSEKFGELTLCTAGIMGFFVFYGYLQEKLMTSPYANPRDEDYEASKFKDSAFLVLCNRVIACLVAVIMLKSRNEDFAPAAPIQNFFYVSLSNFSATFCQYEALKYVTFPTQTLGKCGKMIPVLILGSVFYKKAYTWQDYLVGVSVMIGCTLFLTGKISYDDDKASTPFGLFLLGAYLMSDGFTSTFQEKLFKGFKMSTYNQMLYVNFSSVFLSIGALMLNGTLFSAFAFAMKYPAMLRDATLLSICASLGQMVIYHTIKTFGALTYSTIMTTRQFASLLLSSIIFLHPLSTLQWVGVLMVFLALYYQGFMSPKKNHDNKGEKDKEKEKPIPQVEPTPASKV